LNIYDIAKEAGVSTATVSRYLNGSGYVGKSTAKRLADVIGAANYAPSAAAKALSTGTSLRLVGIVCYNIDDMYYAKSVSVLEKALRQSGYEIILSCTGKSLEEKQKAISVLLSKGVDAIIFVGSVFMDGSGKLVEGAAKSVSCFIINAVVEGDNIYCAYCDDRAAVREAALAMLKEGCKNLLFLYDVETYGSESKREGFLSAVQSGKALMLPEDYDRAAEEIQSVLAEFSPDGIICSNDVLAAAALAAARRNGVSVPGQLKIVGHNNSLLAKCSFPALTSIDNGVEKLSAVTAENIARLFRGEKIEKIFKTEYELVRRESF